MAAGVRGSESLLHAAAKARFSLVDLGVPAVANPAGEAGGDQSSIMLATGWEPEGSLRRLLRSLSVVALCFSPSAMEESDVRRCPKNGPPQAFAECRAGCSRDSSGAARGGMLLAAAPAAGAADGCHSAPAAAASVRPRLAGDASRLKDPILDRRSPDLSAVAGPTPANNNTATPQMVAVLLVLLAGKRTRASPLGGHWPPG